MTEYLEGLAGRAAVVGSGLAGLTAALSLAPLPVVLLTRSALGDETSSAWAQGGIAASLGADDDVALHLSDTLAAGDGLCDARVAAGVVTDAARAIAALEAAGVVFDRDDDGKLSMGLEAAHSRRRIVHAGGDASGAKIIRALITAVRKTASITVLEGFDVRRLLMEDVAVAGLLCATERGPTVLPTPRVVFATGGIGGLYEATTNPVQNFGQGIALAARAGAVVADMEFVQFHPTALATGSRPLPLVSEAVRGEGAVLVNERGERFMRRVPGAELAPRDVVARAISAELARGSRVFLDASGAIGPRFASRFPVIDALCRQAGIDPARDLIPVRPAVHYHMGGIATDANGRSSLSGLWVAGEAACAGLHGANRLASNSLLEAAVMGLRVAQDVAATPLPPRQPGPVSWIPDLPDAAAVRSIVTRRLGVLREGEGLREAIAALLPLAVSSSAAADPAIVGLLIAVYAHLRQESRGAHARTDFPLKGAPAERHTLTLSQAFEIARSTSPDLFVRSA